MERKIKYRDGLAKISVLSFAGKKVETPNIAIVVNPNKLIISPEELEKQFKAEILITNAYIISKTPTLREKAKHEKLHRMLNFHGAIMTDSGAYQMYSRGIKDVDPEAVVKFQVEIGSDVITPLDCFVLPKDSRKEAEDKVDETIRRVVSSKNLIPSEREYIIPLQGGTHIDLRVKSAMALRNMGNIYAIGGLAPLLMSYNYKEICDIIIAIKKTIPDKIIHAFGAGHPMIFSLLAFLGCDLFDSAMYSIAAAQDRYLTAFGTLKLREIEEFPCSCPVCVKYTPQELLETDKKERTELLARHNLFVTFEELKIVKEAIKNQELLNLLQLRARSHPRFLEALILLLRKHSTWLEKFEPISKNTPLKYAGVEFWLRPEIARIRLRMSRGYPGKHVFIKGLGVVPVAILRTYPLKQLKESKILAEDSQSPLEVVRQLLKYYYNVDITGFKAVKQDNKVTCVFKNTVIGHIDSTGFPKLTDEGFKILISIYKPPIGRIIVKTQPITGKVYGRQVEDFDPDLRPGQIAAVVDKNDRFLFKAEILIPPCEFQHYPNEIVAMAI